MASRAFGNWAPNVAVNGGAQPVNDVMKRLKIDEWAQRAALMNTAGACGRGRFAARRPERCAAFAYTDGTHSWAGFEKEHFFIIKKNSKNINK